MDNDNQGEKEGGKGVEHLQRAFGYSMAGLRTTFRNESAFRQEFFLCLIGVPLGLWLTGHASGPLALVLVALAAVVWWRHQENIRRILAGTEPKIGKKKDA